MPSDSTNDSLRMKGYLIHPPTTRLHDLNKADGCMVAVLCFSLSLSQKHTLFTVGSIILTNKTNAPVLLNDKKTCTLTHLMETSSSDGDVYH